MSEAAITPPPSPPENSSTRLAIIRAPGVTAAERYLSRLCDRSFLSLWSYPEPYRDQGAVGRGGHGKELRDLLVAFENHVIIFSDKDCKYPDTGNPDTDWARWYRKAVKEAAQQLSGAERWIKSFPSRIFLDRACTQPFPLSLPGAQAKFHRVIVAHGVSARSKAALGGSGSLMIMPSIVGDEHQHSIAEGGRPFAVGRVDPGGGFVHVLDDTSVDILLSTLDTISDFVEYLAKKEELIDSGHLVAAAGEEDLLGFYLGQLGSDGTHAFVFPSDTDFVTIDEGHWEDFARSRQRAAQLEANRISYAWDALIETFAKHLLGATQYYGSNETVGEQEIILRFMAREGRTRRRLLSKALIGLMESTARDVKAARVILPSYTGDPHHVFLLLPHLPNVDPTEYREVRRNLLDIYCRVVKLRWPDALDIVGIATETGMEPCRTDRRMRRTSMHDFGPPNRRPKPNNSSRIWAYFVTLTRPLTTWSGSTRCTRLATYTRRQQLVDR